MPGYSTDNPACPGLRSSKNTKILGQKSTQARMTLAGQKYFHMLPNITSNVNCITNLSADAIKDTNLEIICFKDESDPRGNKNAKAIILHSAILL